MKKLFLTLVGLLFLSCDNTTSLQEYYVQNQEKSEFLSLDIPTSLLLGENSALNSEQRATLETIKKVNLLAFPLKGENNLAYEEEKTEITSILKDKKYQTLMKFGKGSTKAELYYTGEEDAIDELIVFGSDEKRGFGVARVLGEDMKLEDMIRLFKSAEKGDIDLSGLEDLLQLER